ncbi:MAG: AAA family ATPase [Saccharofermentanales bacterium]
MEKIKVLVVADSESIRYELKNILATDDIAIIAYSKSGAAVLDKAVSLLPDVVIMVGDKTNNDYIQIAERIYMSIPTCTVMLLHENPDIEIIEKAMQAGIRKIMQWPCDKKALIDNIKILNGIEKMRSSNSKHQRVNWQSKVVTVFGTKGGIGKTTVATNLAVALSRVGKKVALIDLDLQFGDVGTFLDLEPKDSISELVQERNSFDIDSIKSFMVLHSSGVSVLCAPKSPEFADIITGEHVEKVINTLRPYFDYVIIDTAPAYNDTSIVAIENSNFVLFIISLDISTLRNAKISMDVFETLNQKDKLRIVVNRDTDNGITLKDAEKVLNCKMFMKIQSDWKTAIAALNKGIPVVVDAPRSQVGLHLSQLAGLVDDLKI